MVDQVIGFEVKVFIRSSSLKLIGATSELLVKSDTYIKTFKSFAFKPCCKIILFTPFN